MKNINQKGFTAVEGLLILVIVGILGYTGWFVWYSKKNVDQTNSSAVTGSQPADSNPLQAYKRSTTVPSSWKKYINTKYRFSFSYPSSWTLAERSIAPSLIPNNEFDVETFLYFSTTPGVKSSFVVSVYKSSLDNMLKAENNKNKIENSGEVVKLDATKITYDGHAAVTFIGPSKIAALKRVYLISAGGYTYECSLYTISENDKVVPVDQNVVKQFESLKFN